MSPLLERGNAKSMRLAVRKQARGSTNSSRLVPAVKAQFSTERSLLRRAACHPACRTV